MAFDIGQLIFVEFLKMSQYPGSPFTGEIVQDLVMFLLVPSILIILVIWQLVGRLLASPSGDRGANKLGILLGVGLYLFLIVGGYYSIFALIAGPYFLFLIIFYGLFLYFIQHFGVVHNRSELIEQGGGAGSPAVNKRGRESVVEHMSGKVKDAFVTRNNPIMRDRLEELDRKIEHRLEDAERYTNSGNRMPEDLAREISKLKDERDMLFHRMYGRFPPRKAA